jgi:heme-degrading monooxygenase HmoA
MIARLFRRLAGEQAHFLTLSYWSSLSAIQAFEGTDEVTTSDALT